MTDKTTPEKIALVVLKDQIHNYQQFYAVQPTTGHVDEALVYQEYIRADLVTSGSADEPLADGQYRWAMLENEGTWIPIRVEEHDGRFYFWDHDGSSLISGGYSYIGPVLQSPPDQSN